MRDTCILALNKAKTGKELKARYGNKYNKILEPAAPYNEEDVSKIINK